MMEPRDDSAARGAMAPSGFATTPPDITAPTVSLPKSGGAIRGIGEKFSANPTSGTGSMSVPIATSPGRSGFGPQLSLSYDSGRGNGPFGFGWSLSLPASAGARTRAFRATTPPTCSCSPTPRTWSRCWSRDRTATGHRSTSGPAAAPDYRIERYRPRVEGSSPGSSGGPGARDGDTHWRTVTRDNVAHRYGQDSNSRVSDPADPARVFSWLLCRSEDGRGNAISYEYLAESGEGVDPAQAHERHRTDVGRSANAT